MDGLSFKLETYKNINVEKVYSIFDYAYLSSEINNLFLSEDSNTRKKFYNTFSIEKNIDDEKIKKILLQL